ncbi:alpha-galactosidase a precursor [Ophiostoma piceae UAMH 11346]|uniref:Alpha-galactosidase a n=1 Tax=Ophiostoma piceae (strain UAMH 11346) TaxID=1262450 RepID=S3CC90_OPHP1|nr:alpha-galactosidase a precursor [Ophiostoma piceae UAMH 11346]
MHGWHPRKVGHDELNLIKTLQRGRMYIASHPDFASPILLKLAFDDDDKPDMDHEVAVYQAVDGQGIAPAFYGHVLGNRGNSVGFITEYVSPTASATQRDYHGCLQALRSLHLYGISHGDAHIGNCLPRPGGTAVLVDFELAEFLSEDAPDAPAEYRRDLDIMQRFGVRYILKGETVIDRQIRGTNGP